MHMFGKCKTGEECSPAFLSVFDVFQSILTPAIVAQTKKEFCPLYMITLADWFEGKY